MPSIVSDVIHVTPCHHASMMLITVNQDDGFRSILALIRLPSLIRSGAALINGAEKSNPSRWTFPYLKSRRRTRSQLKWSPSQKRLTLILWSDFKLMWSTESRCWITEAFAYPTSPNWTTDSTRVWPGTSLGWRAAPAASWWKVNCIYFRFFFLARSGFCFLSCCS